MHHKIQHNKFSAQSNSTKACEQWKTTNQSVKGKRANQKPKEKTGN
jgi:hypothetical protein